MVLVQHASSYPVKRHLEPNSGSTADPEELLPSPPLHTRAHARTPGQPGMRRTWKRSLVMMERRCVWSVTPFRFGFSYRTLW